MIYVGEREPHMAGQPRGALSKMIFTSKQLCFDKRFVQIHQTALTGPHDLWLQDVLTVFNEHTSCSPQT